MYLSESIARLSKELNVPENWLSQFDFNYINLVCKLIDVRIEIEPDVRTQISKVSFQKEYDSPTLKNELVKETEVSKYYLKNVHRSVDWSSFRANTICLNQLAEICEENGFEIINKRSLELANDRLNQHDMMLQEETDYEEVDKVAMKLRMMLATSKLDKNEFKTVMDSIKYLDKYQEVLKNDY